MRWALAGTASLAAHVVLASVILVAVTPDDEPLESRSQGRIRMVTHPVEQSEARAEDPEAEAAVQAKSGGDGISQASIPVSRSGPVTIPREILQAGTEPAATLIAPDAASGAALTALAARPGAAAEAPAGGVVSRAEEPAGAGLAAAAVEAEGVHAGVVRSERAPAAVHGVKRLTAAAGTGPASRPLRARPDPAPVADPTTVAGTPLALRSSPATALRDAPEEADPLVPSTAPAAAAAPQAVAAAAGALPAEVASPLSGEAPTVLNAAAYDTPPSPTREPPGVPVGAASPESVQAASGSAEGPRIIRAPLPEETGTPAEFESLDLTWTPAPRPGPAATIPAPERRVIATLAWSGNAAADIDPVSLAAIQSFVQPGDTGAAATDEVRDSVAKVLASVPCAQLQTAFVPETGELELRGHIPEDSLRAPVLAALRDQIGEAIAVADNALVLPRPQCSMLSGIEATGLPQSTDQLTNPRIVGADAHARVYDFEEGERLVLDMTGPDYEAYLYADYFDADGMVIHLQPNELVPLRKIGAAEAAEIGSEAAGRLEVRIAPPFGQEIVVAIAASEPLYEGVRPIREPAIPYLQWLRDRVQDARESHPGFKGEWVYFFVRTHAG